MKSLLFFNHYAVKSLLVLVAACQLYCSSNYYYSYRCCLAFTANTYNVNNAFFRIGGSISSSTTYTNPKRQRQVTWQESKRARIRKSFVDVSCQGLFGLGIPEIVIISVAAIFVFSPQLLSSANNLGRDVGKLANDLKEVPTEFQKGLEEGEIEAKSRSAKSMETAPKAEE
jgi:sec-independent protein translocase protein TatA